MQREAIVRCRSGSRAAQTGRTLTDIQYEGRQIDQVSRSAHPSDHRPAIGMTEHNRRFLQRVDGGLDRSCVSRQ